MVIQGKFTSVLNNCEITTDATLDTETNHLDIEMSDVKLDENSVLIEEYFIDDSGNEYNNICPKCHEYLTKTYMDEGIGKQLFEVTECPECGRV